MYVEMRTQAAGACPSKDDIGADTITDLAAYALRQQPGEDRKEWFERLCFIRKVGGYEGGRMHIEMSPRQREKYMPSRTEKLIGEQMKEAHAKPKKKPGNKMNKYGEMPGFCKLANTDERISKMEKKSKVEAFVRALQEAKEKALGPKQAAKEKAQEEKEERAAERRQRKEKKMEVQKKLEALIRRKPGKKDGEFTAAELKGYVNETLKGNLPDIKSAKNKEHLVRYLLKVHDIKQGGSCSLAEAANEACSFIEEEESGDTVGRHHEGASDQEISLGEDGVSDDEDVAYARNDEKAAKKNEKIASEEKPECDFERRKRENMKKNAEMIAQLGISKLLDESETHMASGKRKKNKRKAPGKVTQEESQQYVRTRLRRRPQNSSRVYVDNSEEEESIDERVQAPPQKKARSEEPSYVVEEILRHRIVDGKMDYLVAWEGYEEATWVPAENLAQARDVVAKYKKLQENKNA